MADSGKDFYQRSMEMYEDILKCVEMVYDFEPKDEIEEKAYQDLIGGAPLYNAIIRFKTAGKTPEEAAQFFTTMSVKWDVTDLLGG